MGSVKGETERINTGNFFELFFVKRVIMRAIKRQIYGKRKDKWTTIKILGLPSDPILCFFNS